MDYEIFENAQDAIESLKYSYANGMYHYKCHSLGIIGVRGSARFVFGTGEEFTMKVNDVIVISGGEFMVYDESPDYQITVIKVKTKALTSMLDLEARLSINKLFSRPRCLSLSPRLSLVGLQVCRLLKTINRNPDKPYAKEIFESYIKIFTYQCLWILEENEVNEHYDTKRENEISDKFISLVKNNIHNSRKVSYYADKLGITPKYLSTLVKKATGRQPSQWIDEFTLAEIKYALSSSNVTMQYISYELGFATPSHLTKFFHEKTGVTPKEYRRSQSSK